MPTLAHNLLVKLVPVMLVQEFNPSLIVVLLTKIVMVDLVKLVIILLILVTKFLAVVTLPPIVVLQLVFLVKTTNVSLFLAVVKLLTLLLNVLLAKFVVAPILVLLAPILTVVPPMFNVVLVEDALLVPMTLRLVLVLLIVV